MRRRLVWASAASLYIPPVTPLRAAQDYFLDFLEQII